MKHKIAAPIAAAFLALLLCISAGAVRYDSEALPRCTPMIQEAVLTEDGSLSVVFFIENRHGCNVEKFTLTGALLRFGDTRMSIAGCIKDKTIQTGGKAYTVKISPKKVPYVDDADLAACSYELSYSYRIGERTYSGTVDVEGAKTVENNDRAEEADA